MSRKIAVASVALIWIVAVAAAQEARPQDKPKAPEAKPAARPAQEQPAKAGEEKCGTNLSLPRCPVMHDDPVDFNVRTMTADGPVYFCCEKCIKKFEADPAKYEPAVKEQRSALAKLPKVQTLCPVTGKDVSADAFLEQNGQKIHFCCKGCAPTYEKDPSAYRAKLAAAYTYQVKCPVGDEPISPDAHLDLPGGGRVYFCCKGCIPKLTADPAKYAPKLEQQGVLIDVKAVKALGEKPADKPAGQPEKPATK